MEVRSELKLSPKEDVPKEAVSQEKSQPKVGMQKSKSVSFAPSVSKSEKSKKVESFINFVSRTIPEFFSKIHKEIADLALIGLIEKEIEKISKESNIAISLLSQIIEKEYPQRRRNTIGEAPDSHPSTESNNKAPHVGQSTTSIFNTPRAQISKDNLAEEDKKIGTDLNRGHPMLDSNNNSSLVDTSSTTQPPANWNSPTSPRLFNTFKRLRVSRENHLIEEAEVDCAPIAFYACKLLEKAIRNTNAIVNSFNLANENKRNKFNEVRDQVEKYISNLDGLIQNINNKYIELFCENIKVPSELKETFSKILLMQIPLVKVLNAFEECLKDKKRLSQAYIKCEEEKQDQIMPQIRERTYELRNEMKKELENILKDLENENNIIVVMRTNKIKEVQNKIYQELYPFSEQLNIYIDEIEHILKDANKKVWFIQALHHASNFYKGITSELLLEAINNLSDFEIINTAGQYLSSKKDALCLVFVQGVIGFLGGRVLSQKINNNKNNNNANDVNDSYYQFCFLINQICIQIYHFINTTEKSITNRDPYALRDEYSKKGKFLLELTNELLKFLDSDYKVITQIINNEAIEYLNQTVRAVSEELTVITEDEHLQLKSPNPSM